MRYIETKEALLAILKEEEKIVMVEKSAVARVMTRFIQREGFDEKLLCIIATSRIRNEKMILGKLCRNIKDDEAKTNAVYLVVKLKKNQHEEALAMLEKHGVSNIVLLDYELFASISQEENPHIDFLCAGFTKCGTTSLSNAFHMNDKIALPKGKETFYMHWRNHYEDAPARFSKKYFSEVPEGKLVGNLEPSYHVSARNVYECFGKDVKLLFMVRQPVSATFSYYKMLMRRPRKKMYVNYYKKYKKYSVEIFWDFIHDMIETERIDRFHYDRWLEEYLLYFPKEQIKIIVFEELIQDTERIMSEIQDFIGLKEEDKIVYPSLPHSNDGSGVSKNHLAAYINYRYYFSIRNFKENSELNFKKKIFYNAAKKLQKHTIVENNEKMLDEQREMLMEYYKPSVEGLEKILGRSLKDVWGY